MAKNVITILKNSKCKVNQFEKVSSDPFFAQRKSESLIIIFNYSVAVSKLFNKDHLSRVCYFFYVMLNNYNILFMVYNFYILYMLYYPQLWSSMSSLSRFLWRIFFSTEFSDRQFFFSTRLASPAHLGTPRSKKRIRRRNSRKNNTDCNTVGTRTGTRAVFIGICAVRLSTICYCRCATMPLFFLFFFFFVSLLLRRIKNINALKKKWKKMVQLSLWFPLCLRFFLHHDEIKWVKSK